MGNLNCEGNQHIEENKSDVLKEILKDIKVLKARIILLEKQNEKIEDLEKENKKKDEYIKNLERKLENLYSVSSNFKIKINSLENKISGTSESRYFYSRKSLNTESSIDNSSIENMSIQLVIN